MKTYNPILQIALTLVLAPVFVQANVLFEADFSEGSLAGAGFSSSSQSAPSRVAEVTDTDSELYFGSANDNYLRINKQAGTNFTVSAAGVIAAEESSALTTIQFDMYQFTGGAGNLTFEAFAAQTTSSTGRAITSRLFADGSVNAAGDYDLNEKNSFLFFINNTNSSVEFLNPSGSQITLDSGRYNVYVNGNSIVSNVNLGTNSAAGNNVGIQGFFFTYYGETNSGEVLFDNFVVSSFSPIPEPSTYAAIFGLAVLGLVMLRKRLRK